MVGFVAVYACGVGLLETALSRLRNSTRRTYNAIIKVTHVLNKEPAAAAAPLFVVRLERHQYPGARRVDRRAQQEVDVLEGEAPQLALPDSHALWDHFSVDPCRRPQTHAEPTDPQTPHPTQDPTPTPGKTHLPQRMLVLPRLHVI
jgi:hypothetical protein